MAAYTRLASRSQAKCQNNEIESHSSLRAHPHLHRAWYPPVVHFNSHLAHVRMWIWHALSQWPFPGIFEARNEVSWWLLTSLVSRSQEWAFFHVTFDIKRLLFRLVWKVVRYLSTKQDGGCARYFWSQVSASRHGSSSQCDGPSGMTTRQGSIAQVPGLLLI